MSAFVVATWAGPSASTATAAPASVACLGIEATIVGTHKADRIRATKRSDVIAALGGADRVTRASGKDVVCGGGGGDEVLIRSLYDHIQLGPGSDGLTIRCPDGDYRYRGAIVDGGAGDDVIDTRCALAESVVGGPGDDTLTFGLGHDFAYGDEGDDHLIDAYSEPSDCDSDIPPREEIWGSVDYPDTRCFPTGPFAGGYATFEDHFEGGTGNDLIEGRIANDWIRAGDGNDLLAGGVGNDNLLGGDGEDLCDAGPGNVDTNEGTRQLMSEGDCERASGFEPLPPYLPRPNCDSDRQVPEQFEACLTTRSRLRWLGWDAETVDTRDGPASITLNLGLWGLDDRPPECEVLCPPWAEISTVDIVLLSDSGERREVRFPCLRSESPPEWTSDYSDYACRTTIEFPQGSPSEEWGLESLALNAEDGRYSRYGADLLQAPDLWQYYGGYFYGPEFHVSGGT